MKYPKSFLLFVSLFLFIGLSAQKKSTAQPTAAEKNASKMIGLTNTVIDLSNAYGKKYKDYERTLTQGEEKYEQLKKNYDPRFSVNFNGTGSYPVPVGLMNAYEEALKQVPATVKEKAEIVAAVKNATTCVTGLEKWGKGMKDYFTGKEFEKDDFAGYTIAKDSLQYYLDETRKAWRTAASMASDVGDDAENLLLKKDPISQFMIPMKSDLKVLKSVLNEFSDDEEMTNYSPLEEKLTVLKTSVEKNKSTEGKNVALLSHESYYTGFYEKMEKCTDTFLSLLEELSKVTQDENKLDMLYNNLSVGYNEVIDSYNNFASYGAK